jgi:HK97 family phage major capsid protein
VNGFPIHPVTGERAVGLRKDGRAIWPILGADVNGDAATTTRLAEIDERLPQVRTALIELGEAGDLDEDATQRFDALEAELDTLTTEREPLARRAATLERVRSQVASGQGLESGSGRRGPEVMNRVQPYADLDQVASRSLAVEGLHSRALAAIEQVDDDLLTAEQRARAERLVRRNDRHGRIARHMLLTGSEDYARAFEAVLTGRQAWQLDAEAQRALAIADEHYRAINEGSGAAGGFLVPFMLDPTIILTNAGSTNPWRQLADVVTISTNAWHGVSSAGVVAGYRGEAVETVDGSPTFAQPVVNVVKADAYLQASFESMQDTNVAASFGELLADARDNFEAAEMTHGDGAAGHMQGCITGVAAVPGSVIKTATAATFAIGDVWAVRNGLKPRWRRNAQWTAEQAIFDKIRQFATGSGQQSGSFWVELGGDTPAHLIGKPINESSEMDSAITTGKNILVTGDFKRGYKVVDRIGMSVQYNPLVIGANRRPTGEAGWYAYWRTGAAVIVADALRLLQVL